MTKNRLMLGALTVVALTQAGCATQVESLPIAPVAAGTSAHDVALYFGAQAHPAVQSQLGPSSHSVRIARTTMGPEASCNKALQEALDKLISDARSHHANAVVNVTTRFHSTESTSSTDYACGLSTSAAAIAVKGDLVVLKAD
ncbi:Signal peptidase [Pararobbsia alpina]|uniref:signal peptidase n=1 Tax=Pararobbsia alpina TaxID=621374 RepID=UPI0039A6CDC3